MQIVLAATHHDPDGRLYDQAARVLPRLRELPLEIALMLTPQTGPATTELLSAAGARFAAGDAGLPTGHLHLGLWRRGALAVALAQFPQADQILFCDFDRALHWAELHPDELRAALGRLGRHDLTVLGRTPRAFASHPRAQAETEAFANAVFARVWGEPWDVCAAARGLSARAARLLVERCDDDTVGSDCSWPLIARAAGLSVGYLPTEGLEFETLDRYADEVAALGGTQAWLDRFDADPRNWLYRMDIARAEAASALKYAP